MCPLAGVLKGEPTTLKPPLASTSEVDIHARTPKTFYFVRIFPDGRAVLDRNSQRIGECPARTFDFRGLYDKLAEASIAHDEQDGFHYEVQYLERGKPSQNPAHWMTQDYDLVKSLFEKFESISSNSKQLQAQFAKMPPCNSNK